MKKPSQRTWIISGLAAAVVIAAGAFTLTQLPPPSARTASGGTAAHSPAASSNSPAPAAGSGSGSTAGPSAGSADEAAPPAAGKRYSTEVLPPSTPAPAALPATTGLPYPVSAPLPKTASASGKLVSGYPSKVLPQAPGTDVATSSVASQGSRLQVTLTGTSAQEVTDIVAFYRSTLAKFGMYDAPATALAGGTSVTFSRDGNAVTLTATPAKGGTKYVLYGAFTATS